MSEQRPQTYANHTRYVPLFHYVVLPLLTINLAAAIVTLGDGLTFGAFNAVGVAVALVLVAYYVRVNALTVQDRVIRLEERLRMERLLPDDLAPRIGDLSTAQIVALRFAGDDELPALTRMALDEHAGSKTIKQAIKNWRADYRRV